MKKILIAFTALLFAACNTISDNPNVTEESADDGVTKLKKEVMAVHDTAMGKMNTMSKLQNSLEETWAGKVDSLPYINAHNQLQAAHDDMMGWMRNFEIKEDVPEAEVREYLLEEKKAIEAVDEEMDKSIAEARHLLETTTDEEVSGDSNADSAQ